jgi:uncharacterized protein YegP (UPF0339 family)
MTKLLRTCALMTALAVLAGGTTTLVVAQEKKKKEKSEAKVGSVEIYKAKNGFRYRIKNGDGKTVAMPLPQMSWETKKEVEDAISDLKETLNKGKVVDVKE